MYKDQLTQDLKKAVLDLGFLLPGIVFRDLSRKSGNTSDPLLSIPENSRFGEYTTNIPLQLAKQKASKNYQNPKEIANAIIERLGHPKYLERVEIAGPGFLNFFLNGHSLKQLLNHNFKVGNLNKKILVEYADPNTHKEFHIGHLRTLAIGESVARLYEFSGAEVFRSNYGSDIGPTVAKCLWGIIHLNQEFEAAKSASLSEKSTFLGKAYVYGHNNYEAKSEAKAEIDEITKNLYAREDEQLIALWEETRQWSLAYFDSLYSRLGVEFDRRVNESEIDQIAKEEVLKNVGKVFEENDGAIIFKGENYNLHTRVFLTSKGNPTYEAKEVGLINLYQEIYQFDEAIILSDIQQKGFFDVVNRAIELIYPKLVGKKKYLGFGFVSLTTGKMSSREGNVVTAESLIDLVKQELKENYIKDNTPAVDQLLEKIAIAAIKFTYLKYSLTSDIKFDIKESVAIQGDSGVYVLYSYARCNSILSKTSVAEKIEIDNLELEEEERELLRQIEHFNLIVSQATKNTQPSEICSYLLTLSKSFNLFYERHPVLTSNKAKFRVGLVKKSAEVIKLSMNLLGIEVVERM